MSTRFRIGPTTFLTTIALWERLIRGGGPVDPRPTNTVQPFITGNLFVGQTLTCNPGVWYGDPYPTFTYQWQMWNGTTFENILNATAASYSPTVDSDFRCIVTGTNLHGSTPVESDTVDIEPALSAPSFSTQPTISGGTTTGSTLTLDQGTWTGNPVPTAAQQWQKFDVPSGVWGDLVGETALTYVANVDGEYRAKVTLTNSQGTAVEVTVSIVVGAAVAPALLESPQIGGNAYVGSMLYVIPGTWTDTDSYTYQWQTQNTSTLVWSNISAATGTSHDTTVVAPHRCLVYGKNTVSTVEGISDTLNVADLPTGTTTVTHYSSSFDTDDGWTLPIGTSISGGALNFDNTTENVTASRSMPTSLPAGTYTVESSILAGDSADGATKGNVTVYLNSLADSTGEVTRTDVLGTFTDTITTASALSTMGIRVTRQDLTMNIKVGHIIVRGEGISVINQAPTLDYAPQLRGIAETGQILYSTHGVWFGNPEMTYAVQWYKYNTSTLAWDAISAATSFTYTPTEPGDYRTTVTVTNSEGVGSANSASITVTGESAGGGTPAPAPGTYNQYRVVVTETWGAPTVSLAEVQIHAAPGQSPLTPSSVFASTESMPAANAFDVVHATWWNSSIGDATPHIGGVLDTASAIGELHLVYPNIEPEYYEEAPRSFRLEGWDGTQWQPLLVVEGAPRWTPGETRTYTV